jgi:hypothetical protein
MHKRVAFLTATVGVAAAIAGCGGSSDNSNPTSLSLKINENGKAATFQAPKTTKGGLVKVDFTNEGKAPHGVQFIQYTGDHTMQDVLQNLGSNSNVIPDWLIAQGGTSTVPGGQTTSATLNLPSGNYALVDSASIGGGGPSSGPPATTGMTVSSGDTGDLPDTDSKITAATNGQDRYKWDVSGLKAGDNQITFNSQGDDADHLIIAVPVKGQAPPLSQIQQDLAKNGPPPSYVDPSGLQSTAVLQGGKTQTTSLNLKAGQYILFCPLTDRDGKGKSHDQEGLLAVEDVK